MIAAASCCVSGCYERYTSSRVSREVAKKSVAISRVLPFMKAHVTAVCFNV